MNHLLTHSFQRFGLNVFCEKKKNDGDEVQPLSNSYTENTFCFGELTKIK